MKTERKHMNSKKKEEQNDGWVRANMCKQEPVTPTKKPKRVEVTQERSKSSTKAMVKPMNGITKEQVTTKATPLKARGKSSVAAVTNGTVKARDKEDKCSKTAAAKLEGVGLVSQLSQTKNTMDKALPNENGLPNRKRKRLHDQDDVKS
jgi:hypothetical protein